MRKNCSGKRRNSPTGCCTTYFTKIAGGYLANTKHYLKQRNGRTEVTVDRMFSPEELKTMTVEDIEERMNRLLAHDDYTWNKERQIAYKESGRRCPTGIAIYSIRRRIGSLAYLRTKKLL